MRSRVTRIKAMLCVVPALLLVPIPRALAGDDVGPFIRSLWLVQRFGTAEAVLPENDPKVKGTLSKALGKENVLTASGVHNLMEESTFERLAGSDGTLDDAEVSKALDAEIPESRKRLLPGVAAHADLLTTSFDLIDGPHRAAAQTLADWIVKNYKAGQPLHVTTVCTGNSRRSILGATLGNIAAAYFGMPEIQFHSGGTAPTAINSRAISSLKAIGVAVEPTGREAPRGDLKTANPIYTVRWGDGLKTIEFSKVYSDPSNPQDHFAALMVCGEADAACPFVRGAAVRISMPYLDPKIYDHSAYETLKYAERRDDLGRLMLSVMMQVRNRLARKGNLHVRIDGK